MHQSPRNRRSLPNAICTTLQRMNLVSLVQIATSCNHHSQLGGLLNPMIMLGKLQDPTLQKTYNHLKSLSIASLFLGPH
jgi:hypothetical protein